MKILLFILSTLVFSNGNLNEEILKKPMNNEDTDELLKQYNNMLTANMNNYMDDFMKQVIPWISRTLPMPLLDFNEDVSYKPALITYTGKLNLTEGQLTKLGSAKRMGPATMSYNTLMKFLRVDLQTELINFEFKYDYESKILNIGHWTGWLIGKVDSFVIAADFIMDLDNFYIYMQDFRAVSLGNVSVTLKGNWLTDWFGSMVVNVITKLFKSDLTEYISDKLKDFVQETIDEMNDIQFQYSNRAEFQQNIMQYAMSMMHSQN